MLSQPGSRVELDYPHSVGDFPERVERLEELTRSLGEVMRGGFDPYEVKCILCSLGFRLDKILTPEKVQEKYFDGRSDGLKAFENVSLVSATFVDSYRQNL